MMRKILFGAAAALLAVAQPAPAAEDPNVLIVNGRDGVTFSSAAVVAYRRYFEHACPLIMAAHESGRWVTVATGPKEECFTGAVDFKRYIAPVLADCEGGERYGECWVVAIGRKVVWEGRVREGRGKWTPRSSRQHSIILTAEPSLSPSGRTTRQTVGLATYRLDGKTADLRFEPDRVLGSCHGELSIKQGEPSPFTVSCSRIGKLTGQIDVNPDGRSGTGAASADGRHFDIDVLPHEEMQAKK